MPSSTRCASRGFDVFNNCNVGNTGMKWAIFVKGHKFCEVKSYKDIITLYGKKPVARLIEDGVELVPIRQENIKIVG